MAALEHPAGSGVALNALLALISRQYEQIDEERRGVVRSMQLLAEEARSFAQGWRMRMPANCVPSSITSRTSSSRYRRRRDLRFQSYRRTAVWLFAGRAD